MRGYGGGTPDPSHSAGMMTGGPVPNWTVTVAGSGKSSTTASDASGRYTFELSPGHYRLPGCFVHETEAPVEVDVVAGQTTTADWAIPVP